MEGGGREGSEWREEGGREVSGGGREGREGRVEGRKGGR